MDLSVYIGKAFLAGGKVKKEYIVEDIITCTNSKNEIVKQYFIAYTELLGQKVYDYEVPVSTVMRDYYIKKKRIN